MKPYRYILEPYKGMNSRYRCPACNHKQKTFTRYIDTETGNQMPPEVGKCDREINCGYHYMPKQYFADHGTPSKRMFIHKSATTKPSISYIPKWMVTQSLHGYNSNHFTQYLQSRFDAVTARRVIARYGIGSSKLWNGATIFWQMDIDGNIRTGKVMLYNAATGKRVKQPYNHINWVHSLKDATGKLLFPQYHLNQCFFGEHLLHTERDKVVGIVESEKTAIVASAYLPRLLWLACGSKDGLTADKCKVLQDRKIALFPDLGCYDAWKQKASAIWGDDYSISNLLEESATRQQRMHGLDLADYLLGE